MKLTALEPQFIQYGDSSVRWAHERPEGLVPLTFAEAEGIQFLCPKCLAANGGSVGTHAIDVTFAGRGVPDERGSHNAQGRPTRWAVTGGSFEDLSMQPSILIEGACGWHGFITNGEVTTV